MNKNLGLDFTFFLGLGVFGIGLVIKLGVAYGLMWIGGIIIGLTFIAAIGNSIEKSRNEEIELRKKEIDALLKE